MLSVSLQHLELFGKGYVIGHCMAFFKRQQEERNYRMYITDALKAIADNTSLMFGGVSMKMRYEDLIANTNGEPKVEDTRTPEQVIDHIKSELKAL